MRAAAGELDFNNWGAARLAVGQATFAGLAGAAIDFQIGGEAAAGTVTAAVIAGARAAVFDGAGKDGPAGAI